MSTLGQQINFKELVRRHGRIQVPLIQRDYAQGRDSQAEVRNEFLDVLFAALTLPPSDESLPLNLDFVYGEVIDGDQSRFLPLDGQQRLTTLFLLHWYFAWADDNQTDFQELLSQNGKSRFTYDVRPSSAEFFDALVNFFPTPEPPAVDDLSALITDQPWYFRYWRLDPTIQSTLGMLDAIHSYFAKTTGLYARIINDDYPAITFQLLDLENFGLSDDLYIKMNARGKPLTTFETFKARYEEALEEQFEHETRKIGDETFHVAEYFSRRMDTRWADFFWAHRDRETNLFDDAVMNLFRAVVMITLDPDNDAYVDHISRLRSVFYKSSYSLFERNGWINKEFSESLILLLDTWTSNGTEISKQLPENSYFDEEALFKKLVASPSNLRYLEIVQLVGYVLFLRQHAQNIEADRFLEWMRVVSNLSRNTDYNRPEDVQQCVRALHKLVSKSSAILQFFADEKEPTEGFNQQQRLEEKRKAELILSDGRWRPLLIQAENHGYFQGQIEFLLDFCGALVKFRDSSPANWESQEHIDLQRIF